MNSDYIDIKEEIYKVAIIGFGPKGLYGLERLLAEINDKIPEQCIEIHIYNRTKFFGSGDVYRNDQPQFLLMNYEDKNIDINIEEAPDMIANIESFSSWKASANSFQLASNSIPYYSPRALVGSYLEHSYRALTKACTKNITIIPHIDTVEDIKVVGTNYAIKTENEDWGMDRFSKILITTGHFWFRPAVSKASNRNQIEFIYPVTKNLKIINADTAVCIKGFGLTFIDTVLELSEGRGGIFKTKHNGDLEYIPSGQEPSKIAVITRTGLPMIPRKGNKENTTQLRYFTQSFINELLSKHNINFEKEVLQVVLKDMYYSYYEQLFARYNNELRFNDDFKLVEKQVLDFHINNNVTAFDWKKIENCFYDRSMLSSEDIIEKIRQDIFDVEKNTPICAVYNCWSKISPMFNELYVAGVLASDSKHKFDSYYFGLFNRLSYGPPLYNMKKVLALAEAGIIDFDHIKNSKYHFDENLSKHILKTGSISSEFDMLINATIPRGDSKKNRSQLFTNLITRGIITECIEDENDEKSSKIKMNTFGNPINIDGTTLKVITFYGTPTEGNTFDNDTLSRTRNNNASSWARSVVLDILKMKKIETI